MTSPLFHVTSSNNHIACYVSFDCLVLYSNFNNDVSINDDVTTTYDVTTSPGQLQARFYYGSGERGELLYEEKEFYKEAIGYYNNALDTLRKPLVEIEMEMEIEIEIEIMIVTRATVI